MRVRGQKEHARLLRMVSNLLHGEADKGHQRPLGDFNIPAPFLHFRPTYPPSGEGFMLQ